MGVAAPRGHRLAALLPRPVVWTDDGWFWDSEEPWAWATYHYGRWTYDPALGWIWVPGYEWAPAWVTWHYGIDVVGWAPLWPGWSIFVTSHSFFHRCWVFVPCNRFVGHPIPSVASAPNWNVEFFSRTAPAPPRASGQGALAPAWGGPPHGLVEQRVGHSIAPARVIPVSSPGRALPLRAGTIATFRPRMVASPSRQTASRGHPSGGSFRGGASMHGHGGGGRGSHGR